MRPRGRDLQKRCRAYLNSRAELREQLPINAASAKLLALLVGALAHLTCLRDRTLHFLAQSFPIFGKIDLLMYFLHVFDIIVK